MSVSGTYDIVTKTPMGDQKGTFIVNASGETFTGSLRQSPGKLVSVNTIDGPFGSGWGLAGLQELVENPDGSLLLIDGDGSELLFDSPARPGEPFRAPPGDFSRLERLPDGTFRRTFKDQTVTAFDADGRLASVRDRNGNETRVPCVVGRITRKRPVELRDMEFLRRHTDKTAKITLPGPFTMAQQAQNEAYPDVESLAMDLAAAVNPTMLGPEALAQADRANPPREPASRPKLERTKFAGLPKIDRAMIGACDIEELSRLLQG